MDILIDTLIDKLVMSGYAGYVWTSVGVVVGVLFVMYFVAKKELKKVLLEEQRLHAQSNKLKKEKQ